MNLCQTKEGDQKYLRDSERDYKWFWHQRDSIVKSSCCRCGNVNTYKIHLKDNPGRATVCLNFQWVLKVWNLYWVLKLNLNLIFSLQNLQNLQIILKLLFKSTIISSITKSHKIIIIILIINIQYKFNGNHQTIAFYYI